MWFRRILAALVVSTTAACASLVAETPQQRVFALKSDYAGLAALALTYESLPRCDETEEQICSEPDVVDVIRQADSNADVALDEAEALVRDPAFTDGSTFELVYASAQSAVRLFERVLTINGIK